MALTIYGSIGSRASRCLWAAEEAGVPFEWRSISTLDGSARSPEYLAINPSGKIPAMTDGEVVATESMAINLYIAQNYGAGTLWPLDRVRQALALQWTFWSATEVEQHIGALFPHLVMLQHEQRDPATVERHRGPLMARLAELEQALPEQGYVLGDFTLADLHLAVQTFAIIDRFGFDLSAFPRTLAWTKRCRARPARQLVEDRVRAAATPPAAVAAVGGAA